MTESLRNDRRTIFGWAMYDWSNSAFITTQGAVVAPFFTGTIVPEGGWNGWSGETIWAAVVSIGSVVLFLMMPVLGAAADYAAAKRRFLRNFMAVGALFAMVMPFVPDGAVPLFMILALTANFGFVGGNVFYDAFLPQLTDDDTVDQVSSKGYAFGYVGGGLYLALSLVLLLLSGEDGVTGLSTSAAARVVIFGSSVWWLGFSQFALRRLPETGEAKPLPERFRHLRSFPAYTAAGFSRTFDTLRKLRLLHFYLLLIWVPLAALPSLLTVVRKLRRTPKPAVTRPSPHPHRHLLLFLLAFFFYNDGTQTVISLSGSYAEETLELSLTTIALAFLLVQFVAFGGALLFAKIAQQFGTKNSILSTLLIWSAIAVAAYFLPTGQALPFLGIAAVVGLVLGGVQALSRSLYATMIPEDSSSEFFGFYTVFSRFSTILGPLVFAVVSATTGSGRPAVLSVVFFFAVGGLLLTRVDVDKARASRPAWSEP